jgi:PAS domain S-box-containing protein
MRRNVDLLLAVIDAVIEGIITCDSNGLITGINRPIEVMFGYERDELIGQLASILIPEDLRQLHIEGMQRIAGGQSPRIIGQVIDSEALKKSGELFPVALSLTIGKLSDGQLFYIAVIRDITDRKYREKKIQQLNDTLTTRVEALEAFQYSVCHDLNAPLRSLEGFTEALMEDYCKTLDGVGADYVRRIVYATKRMRQLINDMLRLSRVTHPDIELNKEKICLSDMAEKLLSDFQVVDINRKVEISIQPHMVVMADKEFMEIALSNLLSNAWKFSKYKEVARIDFGTMTKDGETVYYIRDNGAGFDMLKYEKLFQPFKRLHDRKDFEGNGIGLTIAKRVIELHDGKVWAEGRVGEGATFYFTMGNNNA